MHVYSLTEVHAWLQPPRLVLYLYFFFPDIFFFTPSTFLLSTRLGVSLGTEAICGGGGRAAAEEQQADNRQQLSGGTLCGSVLLSTLGE